MLPDKFEGLRCLTLERFLPTQATMKSIMLSKNTLIYLDLSWCHFPSDAITIFSDLNNLEHLNLCHVENLNVDVIIEIARNCPKLKHFEYSDNNFNQVVPHRVFCELKYLKHLEYLRFPKVGLNYDGECLIFDIANDCKELKYLNVGNGHNFSKSDISEITKLKNLENLHIFHAKKDSQSLINIASNCPKLKKLIMPFKDISETALGKLTNLKKLEILFFLECKNLSDDVLTKIVDNCENLENLTISKCKNITKASLNQVGKLQYLKVLQINDIAEVQNAMFNNLDKLEKLSCYNCATVTDESIITVIDNCQNLSNLDVRGTGITVKTLIHASKRRQFKFKTLNIIVNRSVKKKYYKNFIQSPYLEIGAY